MVEHAGHFFTDQHGGLADVIHQITDTIQKGLISEGSLTQIVKSRQQFPQQLQTPFPLLLQILDPMVVAPPLLHLPDLLLDLDPLVQSREPIKILQNNALVAVVDVVLEPDLGQLPLLRAGRVSSMGLVFGEGGLRGYLFIIHP